MKAKIKVQEQRPFHWPPSMVKMQGTVTGFEEISEGDMKGMFRADNGYVFEADELEFLKEDA